MSDLTDDQFLDRLANDLRTQDGQDSKEGPTHATAHPVYMVQQRERIYGVDDGWHDPDGYIHWVDGDEVEIDMRGSIPDGACAYIDRWTFVQGAVSLTRRGIEDYLRVNGHNLDSPRIYVASMTRVFEMIRLVGILKKEGKS